MKTITLTGEAVRLLDGATLTGADQANIEARVDAEGSISVDMGTDGYTGFLTTEWKTVWTNRRLSDMAWVTAELGGLGFHNGTYNDNAEPAHFKNDGTTASVQFQVWRDQTVACKCVKVAFRQEGDDIQAKVEYARNLRIEECESLDLPWSYPDFDTFGKWHRDDIATAATESGYGACNLTAFGRMSVREWNASGVTGTRGGLLSLVPTGTVWMTNGVKGPGGLEVRGGGAYRTAELPEWTFLNTVHETPPTSSENGYLLFRNANIHQVEITGAKLAGMGIGSAKYTVDAQAWQRRTDSEDMSYVTWQIQNYDPNHNNGGGRIRACLLKLVQFGPDVYAFAHDYCYTHTANVREGMDVTVETPGWAKKAACSSKDGWQYGICQLSARVPKESVVLSSSGVAGEIRYYRVDNATLQIADVDARGDHASFDVVNGGNLVLAGPRRKKSNGDEDVYCTRGSCFRAFGGSHVTMLGGCNLGYGDTVWLDGSFFEAALRRNEDNLWSYLGQLVLGNGSVARGFPLWMGDKTFNPSIVSIGETGSCIECGLSLQKSVKTFDGVSKSGCLIVRTDADLEISGPIGDYKSDVGLRVLKRGSKRLIYSAENTYASGTEVAEGTLVLANAKGLQAQNAVTLSGGTLEVTGCAASVGTLGLANGGGTVSLKDGGTIAFTGADETWLAGQRLTIVTDTNELGAKAVRFGTDGQGLSVSQLRKIRINGHQANITNEGYLFPEDRGMILMVK